MHEKTNMLSKSLTSSLEVFGLKQYVPQSTHKFGNTRDLFIKFTDLPTNINISDPGISDHFLVRADIQLQHRSSPCKKFRPFCCFKIFFADFCRDLLKSDMFTSPSDITPIFSLRR